jgi:hypothetical protein
MLRFISWLVVGVTAAFLVVAAASFSAAATTWLALGISVGTLIVSAGIAYRYRADVASLALGLATVVVSAWTIVASVIFAQTTVQTLALASALAISGLALAGCATHELENDYVVSQRRHEAASETDDSGLSATA